MTANVIHFDAHGTAPDAPKPALQDIPTVLRSIADQIEAGQYGEVVRGVLVLRAANQEPLLYGMGDVPLVAQSYMDLMAGAQQLMNMHNPGR